MRIKVLLGKIRNGDEQALDQLLDAIYPKIYRFVFSLMNGQEEAKDITQETMVRFIKNIDNYQHKAKLETYVCQIALNLTRDYYRKQARYQQIEFQEQMAETKDMQEYFNSLWDHKELMRKLCFLPQEQKEVILLRYYLQLKITEIADMYQINTSTVKTRIRLALSKLRKEMEEEV